MTPAELAAVQAHLRRMLGNERIKLATPQRRNASVEMFVGSEFVGTVHRDVEDGEVSYAIQIVVLAEDLSQIN
ncbi:DUF3126 family protein [Siccirubricoccus sp. KC 17139]|uniref:DUF3126 family protein n=1 Tax=Siccirubricoccus soli TaxID=2899147 RepID=A0ABT1D2D8_9PROT|nr:DUF3126 family protein [Siccirubricoccus soli]MCO6415409.1 DUF3126 family protein [Siccirubricoccus soli]MCP2681541.1 DUF3126 family protein [Siccirubricoccus soli]